MCRREAIREYRKLTKDCGELACPDYSECANRRKIGLLDLCSSDEALYDTQKFYLFTYNEEEQEHAK
jgi:hypothetical protein